MVNGPVGIIISRNGAYLIELTAPGTEDMAPDELYDCARSAATARRVLKAMARDFGCTHLRWTEDPDGRGWKLHGETPDRTRDEVLDL